MGVKHMRFVPKRAFFEPQALEFPLGKQIYDKLMNLAVTIEFTGAHNRVIGIPGENQQQAFSEAKRTLVVGVRRGTKFATCKPSAHYQLPLNTSCPGMCEYCYLATTLGKKPYLRVYVNNEQILEQAAKYMAERAPDVTIFEGAATSDPIPTEYLTGVLRQSIEFFAERTLGRFRFVTKYTDVDSLLTVRHNGRTRFRFSINAPTVIREYEHLTPTAAERVAAAVKVADAGYPLGFIIAPILYFDGWEEEYGWLFQSLNGQLSQTSRRDITFEFISHRFTKRAKSQILDLFPQTTLPMDEEMRRFKYGQFGYGKYLYQEDTMAKLKEHMFAQVKQYFPEAKVEYFV
jgi:spore photoproduct lyase